MNMRLIRPEELRDLVRLYTFLHPEDPPIDLDNPAVHDTWREILDDPKLRYYVAEKEKKLIASCTLAIVPNLTYGLRPYGVIQNVVTDPDYRQKGFGTRILRYALEQAWDMSCYKVILTTGSKSKHAVRFYLNAGFEQGIKTCFVAFPQ